jgi:hypothetical protein
MRFEVTEPLDSDVVAPRDDYVEYNHRPPNSTT